MVCNEFCPAPPPCFQTENGLFNQWLDKLVAGGLAKPYLTSHMGGGVDVRLNDGQCPVEESEMFYYFRTSRKSSDCGTVRKVSELKVIKGRGCEALILCGRVQLL